MQLEDCGLMITLKGTGEDRVSKCQGRQTRKSGFASVQGNGPTFGQICVIMVVRTK